jgi:ATP-binding cassette, subfamily D (ALD), peroxisomal long-chain fatty acid import protein
MTPSFGKMAAVEAKLEGDYRGMHGRIVTNAEEIAYVDFVHSQTTGFH